MPILNGIYSELGIESNIQRAAMNNIVASLNLIHIKIAVRK